MTPVELLLSLIVAAVIGIWDQWFRKKPPRRPNQPQAPNLIGDADRHGGVFLQLPENLQPSSPPVAAQRVGGVGDVLQLIEDEQRDEQLALDEAGSADVRDAPVNDDAGIQ